MSGYGKRRGDKREEKRRRGSTPEWVEGKDREAAEREWGERVVLIALPLS